MEAIERRVREGIAVEKINYVRATMQEAFEMKNNLIEDSFDYKKIIVDLSECDYIDSTFLGALVYSYRKIKERNGIVVLIISDTQLSRSFIFDEVSKIFRVYKTYREAVEYLNDETNMKFEKKLEQKQLRHSDSIDRVIFEN